MSFITVYLSLGANLGDATYQVKETLECLKKSLLVHDFKVSNFYRTAPLEVESNQDFVNAVCCFKTKLTLDELFEFTQSIETKMGKVFKSKTASRLIDIDILFYGTEVYCTEKLIIPHLHWKKRLFVLCPLQELVEKIVISEQKGEKIYLLSALIKKLKKQSLQRVSLLEKNPFVPYA